jgi:hypothetical protein
VIRRVAGAVIALMLTGVQPTADAQVNLTADAEVTPAPDAWVRYIETSEWCNGRFPYRPDLQEACKWGAYEMLPEQPVPAREKGTTDA